MAKIDEVRTTLFVVMRAEADTKRRHDELVRQRDGLMNQLAVLEEIEQAGQAAQKSASQSTDGD